MEPKAAVQLLPQRDAARRIPSRDLIAGIPERVHMLGAGGAGLSGAARILAEHGHVVSGHDRADSEHVELLRAIGVPVEVDPQNQHLVPDDVQLVVRSAAIPPEDSRVREAQARGIAVLKYSELLRRVTPAQRTLAVAGTHGKTTTSWMLLHALAGVARGASGRAIAAPAAPGALIGGICRVLGTNALAAEPHGWFSVEACEYDRSFLQLSPRGAVVTNVEADHLDYYGDLDAIKSAFAQFANRIPPDGLLVLGRDVPRSVEEASRCKVWRIGRELAIETLGERAGRFAFRVRGPGFDSGEVQLSVPGEFNVENAALALSLAVGLAAAEDGLSLFEAACSAAKGIERFQGSKRRFEPWSTAGEIEVIHDYAHHPTEVRVTLEAARRASPEKPLHVLFQPHQHSRTARFFDDFVASLRSADRVVVSDVYGARTHIDGEHMAGASELALALKRAGSQAVHGGTASNSARRFVEALPDACTALVLGAGDIEQVKDELLAQLALRSRSVRGSRR